MDSSSSISSWDETGVTPPADWNFESINPGSVDDSGEVTSQILSQWNESKLATLCKGKIGPKSAKKAPMPSIREKHRNELLAQKYREAQAARRIQRWYRQAKPGQLKDASCLCLHDCKHSCFIL